jgi:hypothetical protein
VIPFGAELAYARPRPGESFAQEALVVSHCAARLCFIEIRHCSSTQAVVVGARALFAPDEAGTNRCKGDVELWTLVELA